MPTRRVARALGLGRDDVRRTERGGIPIYHAVDDGPTRAALMFRVGRGDEPAADGGITHLVEHLALFPFGQRPYDYNGYVDSIRTVFVAAGKPEEVAEHLTALCRNLGNLPLDRLATEQRVLRDEASRRSGSPPDLHGWLRWGLHGPGLGYLQELGLWRLSREDVVRWSTTWFTAGNAALVWIGQKLPSFELPLPPGARKPAPELIDLVSGPRWAEGPPNMVTISFPVRRGSAEAAAQRILARRLQQRLRYDEGLSYDVSMLYQPLTASLADSCITASAGGADAQRVRDVVVATMKALEQDGPTADDLATELDGIRRQREHPFFRQAEADRAAIQELLGAEPDTAEQLEVELGAVTPDEAREAFRIAMRKVILTQPQGIEPPPSWLEAYPNLIDATYPGTEFPQRTDSLIPSLRKKPGLIVGPEGVSIKLRNGVGNGIGIRLADVVAAVRHSAGHLVVLHDNGAQITIDPAYWRNADKAIAMVEAAVPADRRVVVDDPVQAGKPASGVRTAVGEGIRVASRPEVRYVLLFLLGAAIAIARLNANPTVPAPAAPPTFTPAGIGTSPPTGAVLIGQAVPSADCRIAAPRSRFTFPVQVYWAAKLRNGPYSVSTHVHIVVFEGSKVVARFDGPEPVPTGAWTTLCSEASIVRPPGTYDLKVFNEAETAELAWGHFVIAAGD